MNAAFKLRVPLAMELVNVMLIFSSKAMWVNTFLITLNNSII